jgi:glycerol-3-phosphate dehydrogenase
MYNTDILIIGAGAVGTAIARELSRYNVKVLVVDKNDDVGGDASKACSSIVGVGDGNTPNSLECKLAHASRMMFNKLCDDLDIPINHCGKIMPAVTKEQHSLLQKRLDNAFINGDYDLEYVTGPEILAMEPGINPEVLGGIYSPRDSVIDLFLLVVALAENAAENGVEFLLNCKVQGIDIHNGRIECVKTTRGDIKTKYVINAAGLHCDDIARMVNECDFKVNPRKGQFFILDKNTPCKVKHIIAPIPTPLTRGTIMLPTVHGNMLVGPTAEDLEDKEDK